MSLLGGVSRLAKGSLGATKSFGSGLKAARVGGIKKVAPTTSAMLGGHVGVHPVRYGVGAGVAGVGVHEARRSSHTGIDTK